MRLTILAAATLGLTLVATAASAAVVPQRAPKASAVVSVCSDSLGMLRAVHKDDVMDVDFDNTVVIRPVCLDDHLSGNASGLRGIIGRNDAMSMALANDGFAANDVVGIQFGANGSVLLYVAQ
jgi:hypothetical protein